MDKDRRYDIDWIRVIVFDILILYHIGMFFVPWDWELKNNELVDWLKWPMLFVNRWRLPLLFIISGMGTRFALSRRTAKEFAKERVTRLLMPLIAGILIIVAPQIYLMRLAEGQQYTSFVDFYPDFFKGVYPAGNFSWAHLWFLPYLLLMSLVSIPLFLYLRKANNRVMQFFREWLEHSPFCLYILVIPSFLAVAFLEPLFPVNHSLVGDWYALTHYMICFWCGFIFISMGTVFWNAVTKIRLVTLAMGIISFSTLIWMWVHIENHFWLSLFTAFNLWNWVITILGFAAVYLNHESKIIKYRNQAVYPFYIVHQTLIIFIGFYLMSSSLHYALKALIMTIGTLGGCWILFEFVITRIPVLSLLFGIKRKS